AFPRVLPAGEFRRGAELVFDLALVAETANDHAPEVMGHGHVSGHVTDARRFGVTLLLATGSEAHLSELRAYAAARGFALTPEGLRRGEEIVAAASEEEIFAALGLQFILPELREGRGEIAEAEAHRLP